MKEPKRIIVVEDCIHCPCHIGLGDDMQDNQEWCNVADRDFNDSEDEDVEDRKFPKWCPLKKLKK